MNTVQKVDYFSQTIYVDKDNICTNINLKKYTRSGH